MNALLQKRRPRRENHRTPPPIAQAASLPHRLHRCAASGRPAAPDIGFADPVCGCSTEEPQALALARSLAASPFAGRHGRATQPDFPNIPVVREKTGLAQFQASLWNALASPAKTPKALLERLNANITRMLNTPRSGGQTGHPERPSQKQHQRTTGTAAGQQHPPLDRRDPCGSPALGAMVVVCKALSQRGCRSHKNAFLQTSSCRINQVQGKKNPPRCHGGFFMSSKSQAV